MPPGAVQAGVAVAKIGSEDEDKMKKSTRIIAIAAGCIFFGVAMGFRESFDSMWMRAAIAAIAGAGLAVTLMLARRKPSE